MRFIMFTKHLEGLDVPGIIETLQSVGVDGADLCVRNGYPVNPENIATALPAAAKQFAAAVLSIPLVTVWILASGRRFTRPDLTRTKPIPRNQGPSVPVSIPAPVPEIPLATGDEDPLRTHQFRVLSRESSGHRERERGRRVSA